MRRRRAWQLLGRTTLWVLVFGTLLWALLVGTLVAERRASIYPLSQGFDASALGGLPGGRRVSVDSADGTPITLVLAPPEPGRPVILHFTGNAGHTPLAVRRVAPYAARGYGVVVMNYRGAGGAAGMPGEAAFIADALAAHDAIPALMPQAGPVVLEGVSLGAAVAIALAERRAVAAVIAKVPFAQLCSVAEHHYPWLPACLIQWDERWESASRVAHIGAPLLVMLAGRDGIVPPAEARALFAAASAPKTLIELPEASHAKLDLHGAMEKTLDWLADQGL